MIFITPREGFAGALRSGLWLVTLVLLAGTVVSPAFDRRGHEPWQLLPWIVVVVAFRTFVVLLFKVTGFVISAARTMAVLIVISALLGTWQHFDANYQTAPLSAEYSDRWEEMSLPDR